MNKNNDFEVKKNKMIDAINDAVTATFEVLKADPDIDGVTQALIVGNITLISAKILEERMSK